MRIYTVHRWTAASSPSGGGDPRSLVVGHHAPARALGAPAPRGDAVELVPEGFAWWAAILGPFWALWHRMWLFAAALAAGEVLVASTDAVLGGWSIVPAIAFALLVGFHANDARRRALVRRGAPIAAIVAGADRPAALLRYADHAGVMAQGAAS